jgi:hypothetical protein
VLTQAMYDARELAMTRMQAEAEHLGADGRRPRVHRDGGRPSRPQAALRGRTELRMAERSPRICRFRTSSASYPRRG